MAGAGIQPVVWGFILLFLCRFPGGLKERPAKLEHAKDPTSVLRRAVYGMLPKNKLRKVQHLHECAIAF